MPNPYSQLPDHQFWSRSVARLDPEDVDPITEIPFSVTHADRVATAGSCFAQHIARSLMRSGFSYLVTEQGPEERSFGMFTARFGNIYTTRQLLQLFDRAYGLFEPEDDVWERPDGAFVDPFRPQVEPSGFPTIGSMRDDREVHLAAVCAMFETCDVFVFTLGLTEGWASAIDGAVYPLAPGVGATSIRNDVEARFVNFTVAEMDADLTAFIGKLRTVNPDARVILTVSPVPLIATYEPRHVLLSTTYSKAALRVVAEQVSRTLPDVAYFPSYEIITGAHNRARYFESDLRNVTAEGVENVMALFFKHYAAELGAQKPRVERTLRDTQAETDAAIAELADLNKVICDEEELAS